MASADSCSSPASRDGKADRKVANNSPGPSATAPADIRKRQHLEVAVRCAGRGEGGQMPTGTSSSSLAAVETQAIFLEEEEEEEVQKLESGMSPSERVVQRHQRKQLSAQSNQALLSQISEGKRG